MNRNDRRRELACWMMCGLLALGLDAPAAPSCAVLTFAPGPGIEVGEAGMLANRVSTLLQRTGRFAVLPRYEVHTGLAGSGLDPVGANSALRAGERLDVDYVVTGRAERVGRVGRLAISLVNVKDRRVAASANITIDGRAEAFLRDGPEQSVKRLLGIEQIAPAVVREEPPAAPTGGRSMSGVET